MTANLPKVTLSLTPTPLHPLPRLSDRLGVEIQIKRDDLTGDIGLTGNKVRKLEYLLGDALAQGATTILTTGGPQSNHARATAAAAARVGLKCILLLAGRDPGTRGGNLLISEILGAQLRFPGAITAEDQANALQATADEVAATGEKPYIIPIGGSTPLGCLGPLACYQEIASSLSRPAWICFTSGSGGTHAGLALGAAMAENGHRLQAFSVWLPAPELRDKTANLLKAAAALKGHPLDPVSLHIDDGYMGPRYGRASEAALDAIRLLGETEGILLDHIYTGKAMAGLLDYIRNGTIKPEEQVVFVHTGGVPAIFAGMQ